MKFLNLLFLSKKIKFYKMLSGITVQIAVKKMLKELTGMMKSHGYKQALLTERIYREAVTSSVAFIQSDGRLQPTIKIPQDFVEENKLVIAA